MKTTTDITIIGAGIIGLAIANRLADAGLRVIILERNHPGQEASWAAAGMLAPYAETAHSVPQALFDLFEASHALYPGFVADLENQTGSKIGYQTTGSIMVATDFQEAAMLSGLLERNIKVGRTASELDADQIKAKQPGLSPAIQAGLFFPNDHYVDNRALLKAMIVKAYNAGVKILTGTPVSGFELTGDKITAVKTPESVFKPGIVVISAGAWSGLIPIPGEIVLPVRPIRGQIIQLRTIPQMLRHLIHSAKCYIVPWPDGRTIVGATMEKVGFNKDVTADGVSNLLNAALEIAPALKTAVMDTCWAGLRPDTTDNLPILGKTELSNLIIATGHFRNGILLAPLTAKLIAELIIDGKTSIAIEPFGVNRFSRR